MTEGERREEMSCVTEGEGNKLSRVTKGDGREGRLIDLFHQVSAVVLISFEVRDEKYTGI